MLKEGDLNANTKKTALIAVVLVALFAATIATLALTTRQSKEANDKPMASVALGVAPNALLDNLPTPVPTAVTGIAPPPVTPVTPIPTMEGGPPTPYSDIESAPLPSVTTAPQQNEAQDPGFAPEPTPEFSPTPLPTPRPSDPLTASLFAERESVVSLSTDNATLIITGTVTKVYSARWTTPDGSRPANPWDSSEGYQIYTPVMVMIDEALKGSEQPGTELLIYGYGGQVGQDSLVWAGDDLYDFQEGDRVVLFLFRSDVSRPANSTTLDLWDVYDRFTITNDGRAVNSSHNVALQDLLDEIDAAVKD
jgi:hypothetical protein